MKKQIIASFLLFALGGWAALAQDVDPQAAARLAARRAAEEGGQDAAPATPLDAIPATPADATDASTTSTNSAAAGTNNLDDDPAEVLRKANLAKAEAEIKAQGGVSKVSLAIITSRNIFDPARIPNVRTTPTAIRPQVASESFYLNGISHKVNMGYLAFFSGTGVPAYPPTRVIGDVVNGFKIKDITDTNVTLVPTNSSSSSAPNREYTLEVTGGLSRPAGGQWMASHATLTYPVQSRTLATTDPAMSAYTPTATMASAFNPADIMTMAPTDMFGSDTTATTRTRAGRGGGRGGRGGAGGGFGGAGGGFGGAGGGFGDFGGGAATVAPATTAPSAPADPSVVAALQARRAAEGN